MQNVLCMQMAMTRGLGEEKEEESLPSHRRKVVGGICGGVGKSREWLVVATTAEKKGKG